MTLAILLLLYFLKDFLASPTPFRNIHCVIDRTTLGSVPGHTHLLRTLLPLTLPLLLMLLLLPVMAVVVVRLRGRWGLEGQQPSSWPPEPAPISLG